MSLDDVFNKIANRKMAAKRKAERATPKVKMYLGDTETGRALTGKHPEPEKRTGGAWNMREIPPAHGHATKRHGKLRQVRKAGTSWR